MQNLINMIPDVERNLDQENADLMNTRPYVGVLEKLISENIEETTPFTIGLFGRWGSGKSSIIKTLKERLSERKSNSGVKTVIYDAWKYSGDAFRRSFILEMKRQLDLDWEDKLRVFYREKHEDISTRIEIVDKLWVMPLCLLPLVGLTILLTDADGTSKGYVSLLSLMLSCAFFVMKHLFTQHKISVTTPKIFSPEQFKEIFDDAIEEVADSSHASSWWRRVFSRDRLCRQVVIVIDNIDRCDKQTAKELLLNIKTYLGHKKAIVIMPVDDTAIKSYLKTIGDEEAGEFLRKIFNVSVRLKDAGNVDRFEFTKCLIASYELRFSDEVASVISQEFAKNPRRIIQFLNSLAIERKVALEQEANGVIPNGSISCNIEFLAKILLIKEEYPYLYEAVVFDGLNLSQWEKLYDKKSGGKDNAKEERELRMFFGRTSGIIPPADIRPYLMLRVDDDPVPPELTNLIDARQPEEVVSKISEGMLKFDILLNYLDRVLDTKLVKRRVSANPELGFLIWCFAHRERAGGLIKRQAQFYRYFSYIRSIGTESYPPAELMPCARYLKEQGQSVLHGSIISYLNSNDNVKTEYLQEFLKSFHQIEDLNTVKGPVNKAMADNALLFKELLPYIEKANLSGTYIEPETINVHVGALSAQRTESDAEICNAVRGCLSANMLPYTIHDAFLQKVLGFLQNEQNHASYKFWFCNILGCMKVGTEGAKLVQWMKQVWGATVFPNRSNRHWKDVLTSMLPLLEEIFILGDSSVWSSIALIYNLSDEYAIMANESLARIVQATNVDKWNFIDDVIKKTSDVNADKQYFVTLGRMLERDSKRSILKDRSDAMRNWLEYLVNTENVGGDDARILKLYSQESEFGDIIKDDMPLAKSLFEIGKNESILDTISLTADIILQGASCEDVKYLLELNYENVDKVKATIKKQINSGNDEYEWMGIVVDSEEIWTDDEYGQLLEGRLTHYVTGADEQKRQVANLWRKVNKNKISTHVRSIIEEGIPK